MAKKKSCLLLVKTSPVIKKTEEFNKENCTK